MELDSNQRPISVVLCMCPKANRFNLNLLVKPTIGRYCEIPIWQNSVRIVLLGRPYERPVTSFGDREDTTAISVAPGAYIVDS